MFCSRNWCEDHIGQKLPVTNLKDYGLIELWDDRAVRVVKNRGIIDNRFEDDIEIVRYCNNCQKPITKGLCIDCD